MKSEKEFTQHWHPWLPSALLLKHHLVIVVWCGICNSAKCTYAVGLCLAIAMIALPEEKEEERGYFLKYKFREFHPFPHFTENGDDSYHFHNEVTLYIYFLLLDGFALL